MRTMSLPTWFVLTAAGCSLAALQVSAQPVDGRILAPGPPPMEANALLRDPFLIGDSKEEGITPEGTNMGIAAVEADRAIRMFPVLKNVNVVRTWTGVRVMTQDGFPIYD